MASDEIPVLDCSKLLGPFDEVIQTEDFKDFTSKLDEAFRRIGVVYLKNTGLDSSLIGTFFEKWRQFFELPQDIKNKYLTLDPLENFFGYSHHEHENLDEHKPDAEDSNHDMWNIWGPDALDESKYPGEVPDIKKSYDEIRPILTELAKKILRSFAEGLKLEDANFLVDKHKHFDDRSVKCQETLRSYYYFPMKLEEVGQLRMAEHSDWGTITFMIPTLDDGFEIQNKVTGDWISVPSIKDTIILMPGLMLENWSGGHIHATRHRVKLVEAAVGMVRQSCDLYVQPDGEAMCLPLVEEHEEWDPKYPKKQQEQTHNEYFQERIKKSRKAGK